MHANLKRENARFEVCEATFLPLQALQVVPKTTSVHRILRAVLTVGTVYGTDHVEVTNVVSYSLRNFRVPTAVGKGRHWTLEVQGRQ